MKKLTILLALILLLTGCVTPGADDLDTGPGSNVAFYRKVARHVQSDGWVFTFVREGYKDSSIDDSDLFKYSFFGINLRYAYDPAYAITHSSTNGNGVTAVQTYAPGVLIWGEGSEAQARDMAIISDLLSSDRTDEDLLALDPADYAFEALDGEMFFRLLRQALTGQPQKEGTNQTYWDKPSYAVLQEPEFLEDYKFQVAFLSETGCVDELYIDVLYKTGPAYDDYLQLSDLVDAGLATAEQQAAFQLIQRLVERIKEAENYLTDGELYRCETIAGLDFSRLYQFLENIHNNQFEIYRKQPVILSTEVIS